MGSVAKGRDVKNAARRDEYCKGRGSDEKACVKNEARQEDEFVRKDMGRIDSIFRGAMGNRDG